MNFYIMTLFPEMVMDGLNTSIIGRAVNKGLLSIEALNIRDYAFNKHHSVDDYPYGGGAGMLMQAEPVYQCYDALARQITERKAKATEEKLASGEKKEMSGEQKRTRVIYLSPQERHSTSPWQRNLHRKKIWYFCAVITKALMNVCWKRSLQIMYLSEIMS